MSVKEQYWRYSLIAIIIVLGIVLFQQITPFLGGLLGALTIYILVRKQMIRLTTKRKMKRSTAALLITTEAVFFFLIPISLVVWMLVDKLQNLNLDPQSIIAPIEEIAGIIKSKTGYDVLGSDTTSFIVSALPRIGQAVMGGISSFVINLFVLVFVLYFMLIGGIKMEAYVNAKKNIAKNQTEDDYCILNYEDRLTREFGEEIKANVLYFSSQRKLEEGIYLEEGNIIYNYGGVKETICHVDELQILGTHNHENVMAACAMAAVYGVPVDVIRESVKAFKGVEHRIEYVTEKKGVTYYNDSKGTNPDAAIKAIQAMKHPTVLIGGGYDKGSEYTEWINSFDGKVKKLILLGDTKEKIAADAEKCGFKDYMFVDSFEEAVLTAAKIAESGEAVLLSPACASWDMFPSYEVRGEKFKEIVNSL